MAKQVDRASVAAVLVGSIVFIAATAAWAYHSQKCAVKKCSFAALLNRNASAKSIAMGIATGMVFGLMDATLLYMGMNAFEGVFRALPGGDEELVRAGYGNAYSNGVSAFSSAFSGVALSAMTGVGEGDSPLWANALGVVAGGLIGIAVPRQLVGRRTR